MKRWFFGLGMLAGLLALAACAAQEEAKPAAPAPAAPEAILPRKDAWQEEWERLLAAAKREGKVAMAGQAGANFRRALTEPFQRKYGITVEYLGQPGREFSPRLQVERDAGQYLWDILVGGSTTMRVLKSMGALDPIEPALILPEVKEPKNWRGGELPFIDKDRLILQLTSYTSAPLMFNSNLVKAGDIKSYKDLLDPKWKGKIVIADPTLAGVGQSVLAFFLQHKDLGPDFIRSLLKHDPIIGLDRRQEVEWLAQGKYPLLIGSTSHAQPLIKEGFPIQMVNPRQLKEEGYTASGNGNVTLINKAPHPNAAKVYLNWLLSKEGLDEYSRTLDSPSERIDGAKDHVEPWQLPIEGAWSSDREDAPEMRARASSLAREVLRK